VDSVQQENEVSVTLTSAALRELEMFSQIENTQYFRISVLPGGCSGFKYDFNIINSPEEDDIVLEQSNGLKIVVDPFSSSYLDGTLVHYVKEMTRSGFTFQNPNATAKCGCGSSFTA